MSTVRKQTIVISVLIVLIACAGFFAKNFNDSVKDTNALSGAVVETTKTMNYFAQSRIDKENIFDKSRAELNGIKDNKELPQKSRAAAAMRLMNIVDTNNKESKIETLIKGTGFDDALCMITESSVEVCVKTAGEITKDQVHEITKIVVDATKVSPSKIYIKAKP